MSILVSGGAGYIGSHTCVELIQAGHDIVVVDNFVNSCPEAIHRVEQITGTTIPFVEADLCDAAAVEQIFKQHPDIDSVIHFAGLKAVGESVAKPLEYYTNNLTSTLVTTHKVGVKLEVNGEVVVVNVKVSVAHTRVLHLDQNFIGLGLGDIDVGDCQILTRLS